MTDFKLNLLVKILLFNFGLKDYMIEMRKSICTKRDDDRKVFYNLGHVYVYVMCTVGVRPQCGQPNVNLRQVPAQVNE